MTTQTTPAQRDARERAVREHLEAGLTALEIADRLGTTAAALSRFMLRRGDVELSRLFGRSQHYQRDGRRTFVSVEEHRARIEAKRAERLARLVEDVTWIAGTDTWENIARRVGHTSATALERHLRRYGEQELANRIVREWISPYADRRPARSHRRAA